MAIDLIVITATLSGILALPAYLTVVFNPIAATGLAPVPGSTMGWFEGIALSLAPFFLALLPLTWLVYEVGLTRAWNGATIGKVMFRLRTSSLSGQLTIWQCLFRTTLKILSVVLLLSIGHPLILVVALLAFLALPIFTVKAQALFDFVASTSVIPRTT